jgi:Dyp-type peroxidase family
MLELGDIQGLVVRGYGGLPHARYVLGAIDDPARARAWLGALADRLDDAADRPHERAVNVAFTAAGLARLGMPAAELAAFAPEFTGGMTAEHRRRLLGDVDESAPEHWAWGGPGTDAVDLLLLVYARDEAALDEPLDGVRELRRLGTAVLDPYEHFGFRDGISQPRIADLGEAEYQHSIRAGEFILGHPNEYGLVPSAPPLATNGSYLVLRQLAQDVEAFHAFCAGDDRLAAKIMGRWPSGAPLALAPDGDRPELADANGFGYHAEDPHGLRCPVGAHVRRANPRDSLDPDPGSRRSVDVGKRHRLLRRGRKYVDGDERGLHFICLVASLARQFEFVQHTWLNSPRFAGLYDGPDPLLAPAPPQGRTFTIPAEPVRERYTGLPRFVSVRGGAYFFLPSVAAVRRIARG